MQVLAETFHRLSTEQKRLVHLELCKHALSKWKEFASSRRWITYADSVCGTKQTVDTLLPSDALRAAHDGRDETDVDGRYGEPITAMHDEELSLPEHVRCAYYAIYNAFNRYAKNENIDDWLIVNQSLLSETEESNWASLLSKAIRKAM